MLKRWMKGLRSEQKDCDREWVAGDISFGISSVRATCLGGCWDGPYT